MEYPMEQDGVFAPYANRLRLIILLILCGCVVGALHYLLTPRSYRSSALILPEVDNSAMQKVGDLASLVGVNLGAAQDPTIVFPEYLRSDTLLKAVLNHEIDTGVTVLQRLTGSSSDVPSQRDTENLSDRLSVQRDQRTGVIRLSVLMPSPNLAAVTAAEFVRQLDYQVRSRRHSDATVQRRFLDNQLAQANDDLEAARKELVEFKVGNRFTDSSPVLQQRLGELNMEVMFQEGLVVELRKQRELSRLYEERNVPLLSTLDVGLVPERPHRPRLAFSIVGFAALGFFCAVLWIFISVSILPLFLARSDQPKDN